MSSYNPMPDAPAICWGGNESEPGPGMYLALRCHYDGESHWCNADQLARRLETIRQVNVAEERPARLSNLGIVPWSNGVMDALKEWRLKWNAIDKEYRLKQGAIDEEYRPKWDAINKEYQLKSDALDEEWQAKWDTINKEYQLKSDAIDKEYRPKWDALDNELIAKAKPLSVEEWEEQMRLMPSIKGEVRP